MGICYVEDTMSCGGNRKASDHSSSPYVTCDEEGRDCGENSNVLVHLPGSSDGDLVTGTIVAIVTADEDSVETMTVVVGGQNYENVPSTNVYYVTASGQHWRC